MTATATTGWPRSGNLTSGSRSVSVYGGPGHNAFPGLALCADGSLLAVWRKADAHGYAPGSSTMAARSIDLGVTWSAPWTIYHEPTEDTGLSMVVTLASGRLACMGQIKESATAFFAEVMFSDDHGDTWGPTVRVPFTFTGWTFAAGNLVELADGTLVIVGYGHDGQTLPTGEVITSTRTMRSTDGGYSWGDEATVIDGPTWGRPFNEASIGILADGTLLAIVRCEEPGYKRIWRATSADGGLTWTNVTARFPGWGRPAWLRTTSGGIVLSYRRSAGHHHVYRTSWDGGLTWTPEALLAGQTPWQSVYSQMVEVAPGVVAMVYADEHTNGSASRVRFKYLLDGVGTSPLGDDAPDTGYTQAGIAPGYGWSLATTMPGYEGLAVRLKSGHVTVSGVGTKAAYGPNEAIATIPREYAPDRVISSGPHRILPDGTVRVVDAGTVNTVVHLTYPSP